MGWFAGMVGVGGRNCVVDYAVLVCWLDGCVLGLITCRLLWNHCFGLGVGLAVWVGTLICDLNVFGVI